MTKNHLIHLLELGHWIQYNDDCTIAFYSEDDNVFVSKKGQMVWLNDIDLKNGTFKIVTPAPKLLPVGTKVVVLENCPYTVYRGKEMIIEYVDEFSFEYRLSDCFHHIPHWAVAPIEETEPHKYQEVIDLIENLPSVAVDSTKNILVESKETLLERIKNLK